MKRWLLRLVVGLVIGLPWQVAAAQTPEDVTAIIHEAAAEHGVSGAWLVSVARCESRLIPWAVGDRGTSFGIFQLHRGGLLELFYARGGSDPFDVAEAAAFSAWAFSQGMSRHWSCAR